MDEAFGEKPPAAENVIDSKALVQNELRVEKMALEDQVGTLTVQLNEKDEALAERTSQLIEKQEEIDNYIAETKTYDVVLLRAKSALPPVLPSFLTYCGMRNIC